ncbi:uncharacterized protein LOC125712248 [Brienomyrus brachyistius]|uniref:uncharacterized protein LOC125712248 n=1 Tax=Brienomyrus brachyistius TaxID=42636 RepID=UPI0020B377F1|nr:uncharacterized protein LOC125712248 [Brienomyrus brachyistius]
MESILHSIILLASCIIAKEVLQLSDNMREHCLTDSLKIEIFKPFTDVNNVTLFVLDRKYTAHALSAHMNARCGYKLLVNYNGGLDFWVSLTACHMYLQKPSKLLRISVSVLYVPSDFSGPMATEHLHFSCPYEPSSEHRVVCEEAYIEVSQPLQGSSDKSKELPNESQQRFDIRVPGGKTVTRNRAWMSAHGIWLRVDQPASRITVRVPLSSQIISREAEGHRGYRTVGYHLVVKQKDTFQYNMSAQCPVVLVVCQDGRVVSTASLPLQTLRKGVQVQALRLQLDGVTLSQEEMITQGFTASLKKRDVQLSYALVTNPLSDMANISVNQHHLALDLMWTTRTDGQLGRAIIHIPFHSCRLQQRNPSFAVSVMEKAFKVTYGPVPLAYSLLAVSVDGVFFQSPDEAQDGLEPYLLLEDNFYYVSLLTHFASQWIPQKYLGGLTSQYSIKPTLMFLNPEDEEFIVEGEEFIYIHEDIVLPRVEGYCYSQAVCFNITSGTADHLWLFYVWDSPFTLSRSNDLQSSQGRAKHYQFCVNQDSPDLLHKSVGEQEQILLLAVAFRDRSTGEVKVWSHQSCSFPPAHQLTCSVEGVVKVEGVRVSSSPAARLELLTLLDPTCQPSEISHGKVSFIFTVDTCGTVKRVQGDVAVYENKVRNEKSLAKDTPEYLKFESTLVCYYRIPVLSPRSSKGHRLGVPLAQAQGNVQFHMNIMKDEAFSVAYQTDEYPVLQWLQQPVRVEVGMQSVDPQVELHLQDCWATPTPEAKHSNTWFLIKDGCDVKEDEYRTVFHKVQRSKRIRFPQHYKRFEMKTFAFISPHSQELLQHPIYLHCTVVICDLETSSKKACKAHCVRDQQRRGRSFRSRDPPEFLLTSGSIQLLSEVPATSPLLGEKALMLMLLSVMSILSSLVFLSAFVPFRGGTCKCK